MIRPISRSEEGSETEVTIAAPVAAAISLAFAVKYVPVFGSKALMKSLPLAKTVK